MKLELIPFKSGIVFIPCKLQKRLLFHKKKWKRDSCDQRFETLNILNKTAFKKKAGTDELKKMFVSFSVSAS